LIVDRMQPMMPTMWLLWAWWSRSIVALHSLEAAPAHPPPRAPAATIAPGHARPGASSALRPVGPHEEHPQRVRMTPDPPDPPATRVRLLDSDVLRALQLRQPNFMHCYRWARRQDIMLGSAHVTLHVRVGPSGAVDDARADGPSAPLSRCVAQVARSMTFSPPSAPVAVDLPLYFQEP
jgi:hypothetical protein